MIEQAKQTNGERRHAELEIERTAAALLDKAHQLEQRVVDTKERIGHMVDPREQVRDQPWRAIGAAFALGLLVGWLS